ncbi:MAG TPA: hypothetical protein VFM14_17905 [Gemmatimonadales bacterium]|nr:hypothetical protein [Gemmatimonadales bacterium]
MTKSDAAVAAYHAGLTDESAAESAAWLEARLAERGLMFGDRPLCTVLRPRFLSPAQYASLRSQLGPLLRAFAKANAAALEDPALLAQFGLESWEETMLRTLPPSRTATPLSRIDAFFTAGEGGLKVTEYNAETPAGVAYSDALAELFLALPVARTFQRRWRMVPMPGRHSVLDVLVEAHLERFGRGEAVSIAIVDWRDVPTQSEFRLFQEYFCRLGAACVIADPDELEYRNGRVYASGAAVTVVYKRVLLAELVARGGLDHPLVRAVRDGAVAMVDSFYCKPLHKKASLAVLSDERNARLFSADERKAIARLVPWTRRVEERRTRFGRRTVDLVPFVLAGREQLVLKPNDDYGGAGVVLGWTVGDAEWEQATREALTRPYVVQQRIDLPSETYPTVVQGRVHFGSRIVDVAPYAYDMSRVDGCLSRVSTDPLVNVTAGGGSTVPTFVVEER